MRRAEIWWADLGEPRGSAPALIRPVVIISDDRYNASKLSTVTVVSLTGTLRLAALPGNVLLPADVTGLESDSVVNVTQVATVDRAVLEGRLASLPQWAMAKIDSGLVRALGLRD